MVRDRKSWQKIPRHVPLQTVGADKYQGKVISSLASLLYYSRRSWSKTRVSTFSQTWRSINRLWSTINWFSKNTFRRFSDAITLYHWFKRKGMTQDKFWRSRHPRIQCKVISLKFIFCNYTLICLHSDYGYTLSAPEINMLVIEFNFLLESVGEFFNKPVCLTCKFISNLSRKFCQCLLPIRNSSNWSLHTEHSSRLCWNIRVHQNDDCLNKNFNGRARTYRYAKKLLYKYSPRFKKAYKIVLAFRVANLLLL